MNPLWGLKLRIDATVRCSLCTRSQKHESSLGIETRIWRMYRWQIR